MKLLITGATGFVGRNLVLRALNNPKYTEILLPVRNVEKLRAILKEDGLDPVPPKIKILTSEAPEWNLQGVKEVDHLVHSAGVLFSRSREKFFKTNVDGTLNLFKNLSFSRAVVLSSQAAFGPCVSPEQEKNEGSNPNPLNAYGESKLEMEKRLAQDFGDREYVCLRPPIVLGARDQASLPLFKMVKNPIHFKPGFAPKYYSYIDVQDLLDAIEAVLFSDKKMGELEKRAFFVCAKPPISSAELITSVAQASEKRGLLVSVPEPFLRAVVFVINQLPPLGRRIPSLSGDRARDIWPSRWVISPEGFESAFGWKAKRQLRETLKQSYEWYRKMGQI